jgi:hypothetical protein
MLRYCFIVRIGSQRVSAMHFKIDHVDLGIT